MPIKDDLLEILCCPVTKVPVKRLSDEDLKKLNAHISNGRAKHVDGSKVKGSLKEALITEDGKTIYKIEDDIPIMLADEGVSTDQFSDLP